MYPSMRGTRSSTSLAAPKNGRYAWGSVDWTTRDGTLSIKPTKVKYTKLKKSIDFIVPTFNDQPELEMMFQCIEDLINHESSKIHLIKMFINMQLVKF